MSSDVSLCVVCAWRKDCQKRFLRGPEVQLKCPDFSRDMTIKDTEMQDAEKKDSRNS